MTTTKVNRVRVFRRRVRAVQAQWLPGERRLRKMNGRRRQVELCAMLAEQLGLTK